MKIIKRVLLVILVLIAIPMITALFVKKEYAVEREIVINKPKQEIFDYVKFIKNQDYYSKWNMTDPEMKKSYSGTDGTVGFIAAWDSKDKNVGVGEQEIVKITDGERIDSKLRFKVPFEAQDDAFMTTESIDSTTTKVRWGFSGAFSYPMNIFNLIMDMDKQVGGDLEVGLTNLKNVLEKK